MDVQVNVSGIDSVIKRLTEAKSSYTIKQREFLTKLAEIGIESASIKFLFAQYDGDNDVQVQQTPEWVTENKLQIIASGTTVLFIEFGAGVHYTEQHPKADEFGFVRGTYGQGKGSQDTWGYYGSSGTNGNVVLKGNGNYVVTTHGNPPARAMYDSAKRIREQVQEIAKEVFGSD